MIDPIIVQVNDIAETARQVDCVVNASNQELTAGGGVSGAIHSMFGDFLEEATESVHRVSTGSALMMPSMPIPITQEAEEAMLKDGSGDPDDDQWHLCHVIHTVAPRVGNPDWRFLLERCYAGCLDLVKEHNRQQVSGPIRSIAFPMLGTGAYGLPHEDADSICFNTISGWLDDNFESGGGFEVRLIIGKYAQETEGRAVTMAARVTRMLHNKRVTSNLRS